MVWFKKLFHKQNLLYTLATVVVIVLALVIRVHNLPNFATFWADDGGAHMQYVDTIVEKGRLPTMEETYVAWHEPGYYVIAAGWKLLGEAVWRPSLNFEEVLSIGCYAFFLLMVWLITYKLTKRNRWLALLNTFVFSILFVGVKLSAYIQNETFAQASMLLLLYLFMTWQLAENHKYKAVIIWSVLMGLATQVKVTTIIVLIAVLMVWLVQSIMKKSTVGLKYALVCVAIVGAINVPWLLYKQHAFQKVFTINVFETAPRQSVFTSAAWKYVFTPNYRVFIDAPFWISKPPSYFAMLISDTFADYYNLFDNFSKYDTMPDTDKMITGNGRYTTLEKFRAMLWANRLGLVISLTWLVGLGGFLYQRYKRKEFTVYEALFLLAMGGGWLALLYNNLRLPYLERGVLKVHFILFTLPIFALFAYHWWYSVFRQKVWFIAVAVVPVLVYLVAAWPVLYIR